MLSGELDMLLQAAGSVASDLDCLLTRSEFGRWLETNFSCLDFLALQDQLGIKRGLLMLYCSNVRGKGDCKAGAKHAVDGKLALKQLLDVCRRIPESKNKRRSNCQACYCDRQGKYRDRDAEAMQEQRRENEELQITNARQKEDISQHASEREALERRISDLTAQMQTIEDRSLQEREALRRRLQEIDALADQLSVPRFPTRKNDPMKVPYFAEYLEHIKSSPIDLRFGDKSAGRIFHAKPFLPSSANSKMVKLLIQAIRQNSRIEVCYLHGLKGMDGANLRLLTDMLTESNIWAINLGESPALSEGDWLAFAEALPKTKLGFMFAEMESSRYRAVKKEIIAKLRANRKSARYPDAALNKQVTLMWWNPSSLQRGAGVKI